MHGRPSLLSYWCDFFLFFKEQCVMFVWINYDEFTNSIAPLGGIYHLKNSWVSALLNDLVHLYSVPGLSSCPLLRLLFSDSGFEPLRSEAGRAPEFSLWSDDTWYLTDTKLLLDLCRSKKDGVLEVDGSGNWIFSLHGPSSLFTWDTCQCSV